MRITCGRLAIALCLLVTTPLTAFGENSRNIYSPETLDLSGNWNFELDVNNIGLRDDWKSKKLEDNFELPGSNVENLKGFDVSLKTKFTGSIYDSSWYYNPRLEKFRREDNLKIPFWLTHNKYYQGPAWYSREIRVPADWKGKLVRLFLEHPHYQTTVWVDGMQVGNGNSLNTPHVFDLTDFVKFGKTHQLSIRVDNTLKNLDVGANSHSVTDHTQGNWNGIVGKIELQSVPKINIKQMDVFPDIHQKRIRINLKLENKSGKSFAGTLSLFAQSFNTSQPTRIEPMTVAVILNSTDSIKRIELIYKLGDKMQLWDEFTPTLYQLTANLKNTSNTKNGGDDIQKSVDFGMREIKVEGKWIYVNGRKTQLRGTVENAAFPITGYPPTDVASWERVFRICKSWGLNHMRFHSFSPTEACFVAADKVGFYLQPEGPSWPNHSTQLGRGYAIDSYLMEETKRMTEWYGNHPSFAMLASGNEPRGPWVPWVSKFVDYWKATDARRIYTGASVGGSWAWQPKNMYHVKAGARDLSWTGARPESKSDFSRQLDTIKQPFISHEAGQWCVFPNFDEIKKYTGVTRAKNFELFKEDFYDNNLGGREHEFLMASGKLQALCYKHVIEKHRRTPDYAGYQLLSLNDFPGQGTALVGVLDVFWDEKGYVTAPEFRKFNASVVPLAGMDKFVYRNSELLNAEVSISQFGEKDLMNQSVVWKVKDAYGLTLHEEELGKYDLKVGQNFKLDTLNYSLASYSNSVKLKLEISLPGTTYSNDWDFWVYPQVQKAPSSEGIYIADSLDAKAKEVLHKGGKVLLLAAGKVKYGKDVVQYYQPAFWNTSWFKMRPPHTTGVSINNYHPVFKDFVTDNWSNLNWWELVNRAQVMLLTNFPETYVPIVQPIDTWFINRKLGMLIEVEVGGGKLLMTSIDLRSNLEKRPVAESLYASVINYMQSKEFQPATKVELETIAEIFEKESLPWNAFSSSSPDELRQDGGKKK